jgi:hypothetical protein
MVSARTTVPELLNLKQNEMSWRSMRYGEEWRQCPHRVENRLKTIVNPDPALGRLFSFSHSPVLARRPELSVPVRAIKPSAVEHGPCPALRHVTARGQRAAGDHFK